MAAWLHSSSSLPSSLEEPAGVLPHTVLQQVLGVLDLVLCSCDGDDAVLRAL